jgi:hypothetical protein
MGHLLNTILNLGTIRSWYGAMGSDGASLHVETKPWWCYVLDYIADRGCRPLHWIKFPPIPFTDEDGERTNLRQYYGDLGCLWDIYVLNAAWKLTWKFTKEFYVPLTTEQAEGFTFEHERIWWMQEAQKHLEWEAEEKARESRDKAQS